ncbi:MAG: TIGR04348 family glycosyltransferase [Actinomycetota bacterium]|nr:TIGR04348 family glycosyltransferase [Actinomycetota bacterium]
MRVCIVTPAAPGSRHGNRTTAIRWARLLRELGHQVVVAQSYDKQRCDVLVALHARRSAPSVERFGQRHPGSPLILGLTGTDVYGDLHSSEAAQRSLELATRLVVLQPMAVEEIPAPLRQRAHVIYQSATAPISTGSGARRGFRAVVLAHLREVKDPQLAARAARLLPPHSPVEVVHLGAALDPLLEEWARAETATNPRYQWRGDAPHWRAMGFLARSQVMVLTSRAEGGANVVSEALAASVPILSSRIPGSVGILGEDYPGYFDVGRAEELAALLQRAAEDADFYDLLRATGEARRPLVSPARERQAWAELLAGL